MDNKINHLSSLSSEDIIKELCSKENSKFVNELSKLKKINKEMNKLIVGILQKIKSKNNEKGNSILFDILSNPKISKMLKAFPSKELTGLLNFMKKYKKNIEKGQQKNKNENIEVKNIQKSEIKETKLSINYKNIDTSIENLLNQNMPFDVKEIENIPDKFEDVNSFIDYYFKKEYYDSYNSLVEMYNIMNSNEDNNFTFYKNILITDLEVRCYGIFLTIEFNKIEDIEDKFKEENLLIISSMDSSYVFITEIYLNPYSTRYYHQLKYFTPPSNENNQKIKVKLINVNVLKKLCLITNDIQFQMFEYENQLSLSKITLKIMKEIDIKKYSLPETFETFFNFKLEELNLKGIMKEIEEFHFNKRKIFNVFVKKNNKILTNIEENPKLFEFINEIINISDYPLLIVSKNNKSIDNILLYISYYLKGLSIKKILGHYNNNLRLRRNLFYNYHSLGFENESLDEKIKYEWHNLKRSLSENRVNSISIKFCQKYYNNIVNDFYEISGIKKDEHSNIKSQIVECFLNERNLKSFIQSQIKGNPDEYLLKFSEFLKIADKEFKINYLWERNDNKYSHITTEEWKKKNISYWLPSYEEIIKEGEEEEEENEDDDFLKENNDSEEEEKEKNDKSMENKIENKNKLVLPLNINIKKKKYSRKNYWLLNENERKELIHDMQEQINDYDFNHHNNLIKCIEEFDKQEIEYSYKFLKNENILGMTIYNGIKLKEIIEKMRIETIIVNNPYEVSRSSLISLFHPSIKNIFYLFSEY